MSHRRTAAGDCDQLRVTVEGEPVRVSVCHCLACQRRTGSAFAEPAFPPPTVQVWEQRRHPWVAIRLRPAA